MGLLQRLVGILFGLLFLAAMFVFASLVLVFLVTVGILVGGWMWWRGRAVRASGRREAVVVEGEYRDVTPVPRIGERDRP